MTSNLGHGRLSLLYLILMSSWQMITELNKKHPTQPTIVAVHVFSRPVYKDLRRVWEVHRVSQKNPVISSDHQHPGYLSSNHLERTSLSDKLSFWCILDFPLQFLFPLNIILLIYFQFHSSGADVRGEDEVSACSSEIDPRLIPSLVTCFGMPCAFLPDLTACDRRRWAPSTASHATPLF